MSATPAEHAQIGPYRVLERIGEGGMGVVYLAATSDRLVAVKTLRPWLVGGDDGRRRLEREVALLSRVRGPRIAEVVDADVTADPPYVVTRYVDGVSLHRAVADSGPLSGGALRGVAQGLLEALASVHAAGVVHRDVKPANVLLAAGGPVLIDFGIAHATDETRLTATGFVTGTAGYLAPETVAGHEPTAAADVHGWAATVAFAATGRPPYGHGPDVAVLDRIRRGEHDLTGVEPGLRALLEAALRPDPAARLTVADAMMALGQPGDAETVTLPPIPPPVPPPPLTAATIPASAIAPTVVGLPPVAAAPPLPAAKPPPAAVVPPRLARWRSRAAAGLGLAVLALLVAWAPFIGTACVLGSLVLGRVTEQVGRRLARRRAARGRRGGDWLAVAVRSPWYAARATLPCAARVAFAAVCAIAAGGLFAALGIGGSRFPQLVAGVIVVLLSWRGPGAGPERAGAAAALRPLDHAPKAAWVVLGVLALILCAMILTWESYGTVWQPANGQPGGPLSPLLW